MRGFKAHATGQVICGGHGFLRHLRDGVYRGEWCWAIPGCPGRRG
jgi:hypothetical protein